MYGYKGTIFITFGDRKAKNDELYIQESKAKVEVVVGAGSRAGFRGCGSCYAQPERPRWPAALLCSLTNTTTTVLSPQCAFPPLFSHHHHQHCSPTILLPPPHHDHHLHQPLVEPIALHKQKHARVRAHCTLCTI